MPPKKIEWNDDDGTKYKISYSEELQLKNLEATKRQTLWIRRNMLVMICLLIILIVIAVGGLYVFWRLDQFDFFTKVAY